VSGGRINGMAAARRVAENRILEAIEQGAFDNLPGAGKPLPDIDQPYDPLWWVKTKVARERLKVTRADAEAMHRAFDVK